MKKILIVDNDPGMCNLMAMAFRHQQMETFTTDTVSEASSFLQSGECAGLLMDYHLGAGASGAVVLAKWSQEGPMPPFWLVTGTPDEADVTLLEALPGFQGTIAKPFSILDLVGKVKGLAFPEELKEMEA
ncbi:MAG: response regulator [Planctomycetota bacterium]|nr:response regulator [Planctomycetota bacterium]MDA1112806.1 response regulator [Planctomycetota bacterium]